MNLFDECEPCEVCLEAPTNPLGETEMCAADVRGTVKNEQTKDRRTNNKKLPPPPSYPPPPPRGVVGFTNWT
jgi:hypothetical protein